MFSIPFRSSFVSVVLTFNDSISCAPPLPLKSLPIDTVKKTESCFVSNDFFLRTTQTEVNERCVYLQGFTERCYTRISNIIVFLVFNKKVNNSCSSFILFCLYWLRRSTFVSATLVFKASLNEVAPMSPKWSSVQDTNETRAKRVYYLRSHLQHWVPWALCLSSMLQSVR